MWIENISGTMVNGNNIKKIYMTTAGTHRAFYNEVYVIGYLDNENSDRFLFDNLSKEKAMIVFENLKLLLRVNANYISKEQLLEGTEAKV